MKYLRVYNKTMRKLIVTKKYNNKKVVNFILNNYPNLSTNTLYKALRQKDIKINGKRIHEDTLIFENDEIQVYISDELLGIDQSLEILFEDENILVLNKPVAIEVTGDNSLTSLVHDKYKHKDFLPMPCHRLDRNTTGIVLFAKNEKALNILLEKFKNHEIEKHYLATVYGIPKKPHLRLESYLFKDEKKSIVYISDTFKTGYQKIITTYTILEKNVKNNTCKLDVEIETGKTHQIRAHLSHIGLPIIGDGKYGINDINKKFNAKYQMLHNYKLKFNFSADSDILNYLNSKEIICYNP